MSKEKDWAPSADGYYWKHSAGHTICKIIMAGKESFELWDSGGKRLGSAESFKEAIKLYALLVEGPNA